MQSWYKKWKEYKRIEVCEGGGRVEIKLSGWSRRGNEVNFNVEKIRVER